MSVKAVIFDADGVVVFPWRFAEYLAREHGITREVARPFFEGVFNECLVGKQDLKEALEPVLPRWGWQKSVDDFVAIWLEVENAVDARVVEVIQRLRNTGFVCCLATNQEAYRAEYMATVMGFADVFDHLFFSCRMGCQKPERGYYKAITGSLGLEGQSIFFWDDSQSNVESARKCGWHAEVYTEFEVFEEQLEAYVGQLEAGG